MAPTISKAASPQNVATGDTVTFTVTIDNQTGDAVQLTQIDDTLPVPGNVESHEVIWVSLMNAPRYNNNRSTYRMVEKTRRLRNLMTQRKTA